MKRKRDILTQKLYKWKSRLNVHGGQQRYGINYTETYGPVVMLATVRMLLILSILFSWATVQVDYVLAYPQADIEQDLYMELPKGVKPKIKDEDYVLKLVKNIYGQKQAGRVFHKHMKTGLEKIGFKPSKIDECLFYRGTTLFCVYVDDGLFFDPNQENIDKAIKEIQDLEYDIEAKENVKDYLGVHFETMQDGKIKLTQPHLIDQILEEVGMKNWNKKNQSTQALSSIILQRYAHETDHDNSIFHYRSVIGKLNFLEKSTRPDISYAAHQCARFSENPKESHAKEIRRIVGYLGDTRNQGIIIGPRKELLCLEVYAHADWSGNYFKKTASEDPSTAKSRTGFAIFFGKTMIVWQLKLQTQIALSTTEA